MVLSILRILTMAVMCLVVQGSNRCPFPTWPLSRILLVAPLSSPTFTGLGLLTLYNADSSFDWELLSVSSKVGPKITYFQNALLYKPRHMGPFLFSPLNWFFFWSWFKFAFIKWMISHRIGPNSTYKFYTPFAGPPYVFVPFPARVSKRKRKFSSSNYNSCDFEAPSSSKRRRLHSLTAAPIQSNTDGLPEVVPEQPPTAP